MVVRMRESFGVSAIKTVSIDVTLVKVKRLSTVWKSFQMWDEVYGVSLVVSARPYETWVWSDSKDLSLMLFRKAIHLSKFLSMALIEKA